MKFKEKLKCFREENHMTQSDLANKMFVSRTLISKWENGVVYPSAENMNKLSSLMNEDLNELLSDDETKLIVLDNNSKTDLNVFQKIVFIVSLILVSSGITMLIIGFVFPNDLTRPDDIYNSVNTITVICFMLKSLGGVMTFVGIASSLIATLFVIKNKNPPA